MFGMKNAYGKFKMEKENDNPRANENLKMKLRQYLYLQYLVSFYNGRRQFHLDEEIDKRITICQTIKEHILNSFS